MGQQQCERCKGEVVRGGGGGRGRDGRKVEGYGLRWDGKVR